MKDQYFGDINDYRNFGLLRASHLRLLIAWMLTPNDGSTDGKHIAYLDKPEQWSHHDPALFHTLKALLASQPSGKSAQSSALTSFRIPPIFLLWYPTTRLHADHGLHPCANRRKVVIWCS